MRQLFEVLAILMHLTALLAAGAIRLSLKENPSSQQTDSYRRGKIFLSICVGSRLRSL